MDSMDELRSPSLPPTSPAVPIIVFPLPSMLPVLQLLETIRCPEKPRAAHHERVAHEAELGFLALALAIEPRIRIRGAGVRLVRALLPTKVDLRISPPRRILLVRIGAVLGLEALHRGPGLNQRAIHREVLM